SSPLMNSPAPRRLAALTLIVTMMVSLSGCGTLFYPERKGQLQGQIDPGVAIADGLGLLLFIVPGVIAYAVDFSNNTIYLPSTHDASIERLKFQGNMNEARLPSLIETHTGHHLDWQHEIVRIETPASLDRALAQVRV